jgi:hypothetical protein
MAQAGMPIFNTPHNHAHAKEKAPKLPAVGAAQGEGRAGQGRPGFQRQISEGEERSPTTAKASPAAKVVGGHVGTARGQNGERRCGAIPERREHGVHGAVSPIDCEDGGVSGKKRLQGSRQIRR